MIPIEILFQIEIMNQEKVKYTGKVCSDLTAVHIFSHTQFYTHEKIDFSIILIEVLPACGSRG